MHISSKRIRIIAKIKEIKNLSCASQTGLLFFYDQKLLSVFNVYSRKVENTFTFDWKIVLAAFSRETNQLAVILENNELLVLNLKCGRLFLDKNIGLEKHSSSKFKALLFKENIIFIYERKESLNARFHFIDVEGSSPRYVERKRKSNYELRDFYLQPESRCLLFSEYSTTSAIIFQGI